MNAWDAQATTLEAARYAVWSENEVDYDERVEVCLHHIVPHLKLSDGSRVLDLGCGIGRLTIPLAKKYPRCEIIGYDTSRNMITWARQQSTATPNISWRLGGNLPYVDTAYSMVMFQHIGPDVVSAYLSELGIVMRSGGTFRFQFVEGDHHSELNHCYREHEMVAMCCDAGLDITTIDRGLMYDEWRWVTAVKT